MIKAHVIRLYPTKSQERFFRQSCGVARFAYNWALAKWNEKYEAKEKTSAYELIKEITKIKRTEFPWMMDVGKTCPQYAIHNVERGFKAFFKKNAKHPKFHKKGVNDSFVAVENKEGFNQKDFKLRIPRLGWVKCAENIRFAGKVNYVTVKRTADYWFAVINIDIASKETPVMCENQAVIGVDLGVKSLAITSDGTVYENPKALRKSLESLKRNQRWLSRKVKGSNNRKKQQMKVAKLHYIVSCKRKDALHKATTEIVNKADVIVIEDLNVSGMVKNHKLAQAISDVSFGEFRRQIEYKAEWQGKKVIIADRYFASSKTCSCCGWKNDSLQLSDRAFVCQNCKLIIDRDLNAAMNLAKYGSTERLSGSNACGEVKDSALATVCRTSEKQEIKAIKNSECLVTKFNIL